ncbi:MAG: type IV secretory system conjugative DNA transfer family protein, partial [Christensenellales bacterium]
MKDKKKFSVVRMLVWTIVGFVVGAVLTYATSNTKMIDISLITSSITLVGAGIGLLTGFVMELSKLMSASPSNEKTKVKNKEGQADEQYFNSRFVSEKELRTDKKFKFYLWKDLYKCDNEGIVIRAELQNKDLLINMYKPIHTLVIGTTGSGKTQGFVVPTIQILSETAAKPSMVISDPKGELYLKNKVKLEKSGYDVKVVDLREPSSSDRWNPLDRAYDNYHRANNLLSEVKVYKNVSPGQVPKIQTIKGSTYYNEWYEFGGIAYPSKEALNNDLKALKDK